MNTSYISVYINYTSTVLHRLLNPMVRCARVKERRARRELDERESCKRSGPGVALHLFPMEAHRSQTAGTLIGQHDEGQEGDAMLPAGLEAARDAAMLAFIKSESGPSGVRYCDQNSLCSYWSGQDPYEVERNPPVRLAALLSRQDIADCHAAAAVRSQYPDQEVLDQGDICAMLANEPCDNVFSPEHVACYLHRDDTFASLQPRLLDRLLAVMCARHDGLVLPKVPLHVRCVELHAYSTNGALLDAGHKDNGSKRTLIIQLSDATAFEGGQFVTWHEGEAVLHELQAGDGLLIDSEKMHNVAPVTCGIRHSLVIEIWVAPPNTYNRFR